jgi:hypothetical protein
MDVWVTYPVIGFYNIKAADGCRRQSRTIRPRNYDNLPRVKSGRGKTQSKTKDLNRDAQTRHTHIGGGTPIPRAGTSTKAGTPAGTDSSGNNQKQQEANGFEKQKQELEKEHAALQTDIERQRAEAERDLLKAALERERIQAAGFFEQVKLQSELLAKILPWQAVGLPEGRTGTGADAAFVSGLVGYHAVKRVAADITRGITATVGLGNDVRILIVDRPDYAAGDIPYIEVTSQLSVFEVRCRKQVATNKELADLAMQEEERSGDEKALSSKAGTTRLAPLAAAPPILPAVSTAVTTIPAVPGLVGTAADIAGFFRSDYFSGGHDLSLKSKGLTAAVAGSLKSEKRYVYVYNFYSMDTTGPQSKLMNMYAGMLDCSSRLAQSRNRLLYFISKKTERLAELKLSSNRSPEGAPIGTEQAMKDLIGEIRQEAAWMDRATAEVLASDAIHAELGSFIKMITTAGPGQSGSKLAQAVFREKVHELGITHLLYLGVLASGGETVTRKWLLGSGTVCYMGGAVVSYVLSRVEGEVLASDTLPVLFSFEFDPAGQRHSPIKQIRFEKQEPKK